jgi:hypothetical protein
MQTPQENQAQVRPSLKRTKELRNKAPYVSNPLL